ncbi:MAG: hypothetical protein V4662_11905 [Verrucomicrobiota bacterium]
MNDSHPYPHAPERTAITEAVLASMVSGLAQLAAKAHPHHPTGKVIIEDGFALLDRDLAHLRAAATSTKEAA